MNDRENRVKLVADRQILEADRIGCHPCVNTASLAFSVRDLLEKVLPATAHQVQIIDIP
jgi:Ala-tRNA(Pro) deacylase